MQNYEKELKIKHTVWETKMLKFLVTLVNHESGAAFLKYSEITYDPLENRYHKKWSGRERIVLCNLLSRGLGAKVIRNIWHPKSRHKMLVRLF